MRIHEEEIEKLINEKILHIPDDAEVDISIVRRGIFRVERCHLQTERVQTGSFSQRIYKISSTRQYQLIFDVVLGAVNVLVASISLLGITWVVKKGVEFLATGAI